MNQINTALHATDGIHMTIRELGAQDDRDRQFLCHQEGNALQRISKTTTKYHLMLDIESMPTSVSEARKSL